MTSIIHEKKAEIAGAQSCTYRPEKNKTGQNFNDTLRILFE